MISTQISFIVLNESKEKSLNYSDMYSIYTILIFVGLGHSFTVSPSVALELPWTLMTHPSFVEMTSDSLPDEFVIEAGFFGAFFGVD